MKSILKILGIVVALGGIAGLILSNQNATDFSERDMKWINVTIQDTTSIDFRKKKTKLKEDKALYVKSKEYKNRFVFLNGIFPVDTVKKKVSFIAGAGIQIQVNKSALEKLQSSQEDSLSCVTVYGIISDMQPLMKADDYLQQFQKKQNADRLTYILIVVLGMSMLIGGFLLRKEENTIMPH